MNNPKCSACGGAMKRNGRTKSGAQRWRCRSCGASMAHRIDSSAKHLKAFLRWLLGKLSVAEAASCSKDTFRRRAERFWKMWPLPVYTGEVHDVVFVDGIYVTRKLVVLIACSREHVLAWHLAQSECSSAWAALMTKVPAPAMVVTDGGSGFRKAARAVWPNTRVQRCLVHVSRQVKRKTTLNPQLDAGKELLELAQRLAKVKGPDAAATWMADYAGWCAKWERFLREFTLKDGRKQYVHERLRSARRSLNALVKEGTLFTFIELQESVGGAWDSTNNIIEGRVNAQIREMLRAHRGLSTMRRVKAVFWWCYMDSEFKVSEAEMLRTMKTDEEVEGLFASASKPKRKQDGSPEEYGSGVSWNEFHIATEYRQ
ncbi:IS1249 family transposase [Eggerthellaceae bacterium zg-887]|uniref:IS1249 family transposase n=1 Tax=Xiamenia xianingshaonis TaxID=2682776 RepID=UPI0014089819|nr:IS1249 family transposase [Xiamenia xianingshaonis]NHM15673.1 IS1249 family transposase [Xiamenia xianingshaonis]